jgi:hypothetical protein
MTLNLSPSEYLMYSTVRIESYLKTGDVCTGTGFFYVFESEGKNSVPVIVTNKHVIKGADKGKILFTCEDAEGNPDNTNHYEMILSSFEDCWWNHPDEDVDLCILPIYLVLKRAESEGKKIFIVSLNEEILPSKEKLAELSAVEEIKMVGYPNGLWDMVNNLPIIRSGITATHPKFNHNGREEFLIDCACFPGSSGSPVIIFNHGSFSSHNGLHLGSRIIFLGILYAGPQFTATGEIIKMNVPTSRPIAISQIPMNLGYIIKSHKLLDFKKILDPLLDAKTN